MKYIVKKNDEILDEIVANHYGSSFGYLELVLNANTFLYEQPIFLNVGTVIELPEVKKESKSRVNLWS